MTRVPDATLALPVQGLNLAGDTLADAIDARPGAFTMIAFLRHFGCLFGREMVRDIHAASTAIAGFPTPLFVGLGDRDETIDFMKPMWPEAPVICDPERALFNAFEISRGGVLQMFGPSVWACQLRATFKGNFIGKRVGDPWTMPGVFIVDRARAVRYQHEFKHTGDHPVWAKLPGMISSKAEHPPMAAALA